MRDLFDDLVAHGLTIITEPPPPAQHYFVPFHKVTSESFTKSEFTPKPYETDILKILEENSVKEITEAEDDLFMKELKKLYGTLG